MQKHGQTPTCPVRSSWRRLSRYVSTSDISIFFLIFFLLCRDPRWVLRLLLSAILHAHVYVRRGWVCEREIERRRERGKRYTDIERFPGRAKTLEV